MGLLGLFIIAAGPLQANDTPELHPAIQLLDESGTNVLVSSKPYSSRQSCGGSGCHDYDSITHAFHFEMGRDEARDDFGADHGVPQLVSSGYFGGYNCMGGNNPDTLAKKVNASSADFADLGAAGWIQRCSSCHMGGGWMEKDRNGVRYDQKDPATVKLFDGDYFNRGTDKYNHAADSGVVARWDWKKSGVVEADCLICHGDFREMIITDPKLNVEGASDAHTQFKTLRRSYLIGQGYFRESGSAILEFLNLSHPGCSDAAGDGCATTDTTLLNFSRETDGSGGHGDHSVHTSTKPAYALNHDGAMKPVINWNADAFHLPNGNPAAAEVTIPMLRFPANDNCMMCHITGNSRRAFYGFGENAESTEEEDGTIVEDYQDDIHKGKLWTENGVERSIEVCNTCHGRNYFRDGGYDLNADHNFPKGNSDMELRNDQDYKPNALSCEYCHDESDNSAQANPSGYEDMLSAHRERWKFAGDMAGYPGDEETLSRITRTHLDVVSCQACHITGKVYRGQPMQIMYRYRQAENGKQTIVPYNPRVRYYWKDKNSGRVLTKTERDSVFEMREDGDDRYGVIVDPVSRTELAQVSVRYSHGAWRFGDPSDYAGFVALKSAYDKVLQSKGVAGADTALVWTDTAMYLMSHNTRPAVSSVQCEECHDKRQDGAISALVSPDGLFGEGELATKEVASVPDKRLVDEGIILLDMPYMKLNVAQDGSATITENVSDILYGSSLDPSMSVLRAARAGVMSGGMDAGLASADVLRASGITHQSDVEQLTALLVGDRYYQFAPQYGDNDIRRVALMMESNAQTDLVFPTYRMSVALAPGATVDRANGAGLGGLVSPVLSLEASDSSGAEVNHFISRMLVKIPYNGNSADPAQISIITSADGISWSRVDSDDIVLMRPQSNLEQGYAVFWTDHFSYYAVTDNSASSSDGTTPATSGGGGGGAVGWPLLLSLLGLGLLYRRSRR